jgi:phosphoadenosine phosphosulfate reductase
MLYERDRLYDILNEIKGAIGFSCSYQAEDIALLHLLKDHDNIEIFTLETLKHFHQSETFHNEIERFFNVKIIKYYPDQSEVKELETELGDYGMRESLEKRRLCCDIRKVRPLERALKNKSAWITGLRAAQSITRANLQLVEYDEKYRLLKINPIFDWSEKELYDYIAQNDLPLHPLYAEGFKSIGCEPCTRAVAEGEDIRSGRWWWENPEHKECGLHIKG